MLIKLERAIERLVEGSIAGAFRLQVQPAEIGRQLERAMRDGRRSSVGGSLAPHCYLVRLHPDDAAAFAGWELALAHELERWLAELAFAKGFATIGPIEVRVVPDEAVRRRAVRVDADFAAASIAEPKRQNRTQTNSLRLLPQDDRFPVATLSLSLVHVGRGNDNDLILNHPEVSRRHARFEPIESGWQVMDLGSTNGTWHNDSAVARAFIAHGDAIAFGGVRYTVVVE